MSELQYEIYFRDTGESFQWSLEKCLQIIGRDSMEEGLRGYGVDVIVPSDALNHPTCAECEAWVFSDVLDSDGCAPCCTVLGGSK